MKITATLTEQDLKWAVAMLVREQQKLGWWVTITVTSNKDGTTTATWDPHQSEPVDARD